jgi:hypothetical protein
MPKPPNYYSNHKWNIYVYHEGFKSIYDGVVFSWTFGHMQVGYSCMLSLFIFQVPMTCMVGYNHVYVGHGSIMFLKNNSRVFLLIIICMWAMSFLGFLF